MSTPSFNVDAFLHSERLGSVVTATVLILIGWLLGRVFARMFERAAQQRLSAHQIIIWRRTINYAFIALFAVAGLREMGFHLSVLLGAAGVLSVAVGFASQTSASNLISGLFLIGERSFAIGDFIRVGQTEGEVLAIDLLSVKLRTPDNLYVRLPNEQLIRSELTNLTRFPVRRIDLALGVAYKEDLGQVRQLLLGVAQRDPQCLDEPSPEVIVMGFGDSAVNLTLQAWTRRENYREVRNRLHESIKRAFDDGGVEIPFPQIAVNASSTEAPIRVAMHPVVPPADTGSAPDDAP
jgi:small-conductance mechanosensitive channel